MPTLVCGWRCYTLKFLYLGVLTYTHARLRWKRRPMVCINLSQWKEQQLWWLHHDDRCHGQDLSSAARDTFCSSHPHYPPPPCLQITERSMCFQACFNVHFEQPCSDTWGIIEEERWLRRRNLSVCVCLPASVTLLFGVCFWNPDRSDHSSLHTAPPRHCVSVYFWQQILLLYTRKTFFWTSFVLFSFFSPLLCTVFLSAVTHSAICCSALALSEAIISLITDEYTERPSFLLSRFSNTPTPKSFWRLRGNFDVRLTWNAAVQIQKKKTLSSTRGLFHLCLRLWMLQWNHWKIPLFRYLLLFCTVTRLKQESAAVCTTLSLRLSAIFHVLHKRVN